MQRPDDDHRLPTLLFLLIITLIHIPTSFCQDKQYVDCGQSYLCGNANLTYPFWGGSRPDYCGYPGFEVTCRGNFAPTITVSPVVYRVLESPDTTAHTIRVARGDLYTNSCPTDIQDTVMNFTIFSYFNSQNLSLFYGCPPLPPGTPLPPSWFSCNGNPTANYYFPTNALDSNNTPASCTSNITVPINGNGQNLVGAGGLTAALVAGFTLKYEANNANCERCSRSGGRCGYNIDSNSFVCYCSDRAYDLVCNGTSNNQTGNVAYCHE